MFSHSDRNVISCGGNVLRGASLSAEGPPPATQWSEGTSPPRTRGAFKRHLRVARNIPFVFTALVFIGTVASAQTLTPERLRTEYLENPVGLDAAQPRLSWIVTSPERGARQTAYQIIVATSEAEARAAHGDLWDSGKVVSDDTAQVLYAGKPLASGQQAWWTVRAWDRNDVPSPATAPASWEMGLLTPADRHGDWIGRATSSRASLAGDRPVPLLRRSFSLDGKIKRARAYVIGLGYFELTVNGQRIGDHVLDPAFTRYDRRLLYVTHDVAPSLRAGENVLGVMLGNGWFNVHAKAAWDFDQAPWRATPRLLLELRIEMEDGRRVIISTDEKWKTSDGPITFSSIYGGENYDARLEQPGWDAPAFNDNTWQPALVLDAPKGKIVAQTMHPVRVAKTLKPIAVTEPEPGVYVFDTGQNLAGNAELALTAAAGTRVSLRYSEKLDAKGRLDRANISRFVVRRDEPQQFQTDIFTHKGGDTEHWKSRFAYHGFRYVEITGAPGKLTADNLAVHFIHSDVPEVGQFETSNPVLNRIWANGRWSYLSNLVGIPTDCPHREKNGWTGDAQVACEQGLFYQDGITVYEKWINDLADEQFITGALPGIVPTSGQWGYAFGSGPAWDSAFLIVPWHLYEYYGDTTALRRNFEGYKKYVDYLTSRAKDGIVAIGLGDWSVWRARTPEALTDTGYYYHDARIVAAVARMLNRQADAKKYDELAERIRTAFNKTFYNSETALYSTGTQTALGAALFHGLVEPPEETRVIDALVAAIANNDQHLDFGFLGSQYVPNALAAHGRADVAYAMIMQKTPPSYAAQVGQGATTLWETWNGGASQNHTFFGDVNAWMMKNIAGIASDPAAPGFKKIIIAPQVLGDLTWANGSYDSIRGRVVSEWKLVDGEFRLHVVIPANCQATISLPAAAASRITEGGRALAASPEVTVRDTESGHVRLEVGSGDYNFSVR